MQCFLQFHFFFIFSIFNVANAYLVFQETVFFLFMHPQASPSPPLLTPPFPLSETTLTPPSSSHKRPRKFLPHQVAEDANPTFRRLWTRSCLTSATFASIVLGGRLRSLNTRRTTRTRSRSDVRAARTAPSGSGTW